MRWRGKELKVELCNDKADPDADADADADAEADA